MYQATETAQLAVSLPAKTCNVVCCPQCGEKFEPANRRQRFCGAVCRVAAHRASKPKPDLKFYQDQRTGISMSFDGRDWGHLRDVGIDRPAGYAARQVLNASLAAKEEMT